MSTFKIYENHNLTSQVYLTDVLRLAVHAAYGACEIIQRIASRGTTKIELKDITDPKSALTEADELAQAYILELFACSFPEISVVGEEDEATPETTEKLTTLKNELQRDGRLKLYEGHFSENLDEGNDCERNLRLSENSSCLLNYQKWLKESIKKKLDSNSLDADSKSYLLNKIRSERICIFIDPLDGTGEFVAKRYEAVQTLIGIAIDGRPIAGVIGIPFPPKISQPKLLFGVVGLGISGDLEELHECYKINMTCESLTSFVEQVQTVGTNKNGILLQKANEFLDEFLRSISGNDETDSVASKGNSNVGTGMKSEINEANTKKGRSSTLTIAMSTDMGKGVPPCEVLRNALLYRENQPRTDLLLGMISHKKSLTYNKFWSQAL